MANVSKCLKGIFSIKEIKNKGILERYYICSGEGENDLGCYITTRTDTTWTGHNLDRTQTGQTQPGRRTDTN